jgi:hypothetical protein
MTAKHRKTRRDIHTLSGIRVQDHSIQAAKTRALDRAATAIHKCSTQRPYHF